MKFLKGAVAAAWLCACGDVTSQAIDAPTGGEDAAGSDSGMPDACVPSTERLDDTDNDCDGLIDEGFWVTVFTTPIAVLAAWDPACDSEAAIRSNPYACQLAARRECKARGYTAGFRPAEVTSTEVGFTCLADVQLFSGVSYTDLSAHIPSCSAETAFRGECFAAIKRYCQAKGFKVGIGPLNADSFASIDLVCTDHAEYVELSFDELRATEAGCDLPGNSRPWDFSCFHAYRRRCLSAGWASAWGPIEFAASAHVACLSVKPAG